MHKKQIQVLSRIETRHWHSPFSKILREARQLNIIHRCRQSAQTDGYTEFVIYDAYETLVASGLAE